MRIPKPHTDFALVRKIEEFLDQDYLTEIDTERQLGEESDGLVRQRARGRTGRPNKRSNFVRPMFEVMPEGYSGTPRQYSSPCPACDDWSRTPRCSEHPEVGVERSRLGARTPTPAPDFGTALTEALAGVVRGPLTRRFPTDNRSWSNATISVETSTEHGTSVFRFEVEDGH